MIKRKTGKFTNCHYPIFDKYPSITAVSSTLESPFGELETITSDDTLYNHLDKTEKKWLNEIYVPQNDLVTIKQVHENSIFEAERPGFAGEYDGIVTISRNLFLRIVTADCIPVFLFDPDKEITGLVHAGWRSLHAEILPNVLDKMKAGFGSNPVNILAAFGPFIGDCCYEVGEDVAGKFSPDFTTKKGKGKYMLDLGRAAVKILIENGVLPGNIENSGECTSCHPISYFSARRGPYSKGRLIHIMGMN
ncbi:peptidoglycan editing factor PgeF [candidate division KSB1 bacterium]